MATSALQSSPAPCMDRLDAARALLGVSPGQAEGGAAAAPEEAAPQRSLSSSSEPSGAPERPPAAPGGERQHHHQQQDTDISSGGGAGGVGSSLSTSATSPGNASRPTPSTSCCDRTNALDALATLATSASVVINYDPLSDDSAEDQAMPPPPPRGPGRLRSASNPEGMEKWDSMGRGRSSRMHFVLPSSILEEELADANLACEKLARSDAAAARAAAAQMESASSARGSGCGLPLKKRLKEERQGQQQSQQHGLFSPDQFGTSPNSVLEPMVVDGDEEMKEDCGGGEGGGRGTTDEEDSNEGDDNGEGSGEGGAGDDSPMEDEDDEADLEPAELLRRARARLLEDLSTEGTMGEKGVLPLPHSLSKYKEVYNKNGRIGIYTPAERAAIIAKFQSKRTRRVWNKKIRYNCRKSLADRRMRVKGRFVKRSTEAAAKRSRKEAGQPKAEGSDSPATNKAVAFADDAAAPGKAGGPSGSSADTSASSSRASSPDPAAPSSSSAAAAAAGGGDSDMPDVNDEEAGFVPTKDQPFRRTRRHTIT